jgi:hypothetical protein
LLSARGHPSEFTILSTGAANSVHIGGASCDHHSPAPAVATHGVISMSVPLTCRNTVPISTAITTACASCVRTTPAFLYYSLSARLSSTLYCRLQGTSWRTCMRRPVSTSTHVHLHCTRVQSTEYPLVLLLDTAVHLVCMLRYSLDLTQWKR